MAQKTIVTLVDDLTGEEAEDITTVEFALDGVTYEIDLDDKNSTKLRDALAEYIGAARRTGGRRASTGRRSRSGGAGTGTPRATSPAATTARPRSRSANGPSPRASRCPTAAACPTTWSRRGRPSARAPTTPRRSRAD